MMPIYCKTNAKSTHSTIVGNQSLPIQIIVIFRIPLLRYKFDRGEKNQAHHGGIRLFFSSYE